ncbi:matrixin family metalloprotease, partial [Myxococcota bacterium]|nr:matrixin family metalloprotease [Myxococcota bacterium]
LPDDRERQVLRASWAEWNNIIGCAPDLSTSDFQFIETEYVSGSQRVGFNALIPSENENISLFYDQDWPHGGSSCSIIALTTVTYKAQNGEIIDADIEYNSEYCGFTIVGELSSSDPVDLMNTAVHEIGHVVGLGHSTNSLSTMYPQAFGNETHKRDLACDDKTGIVFKYPTQMENGYCDPPNAECGYCAPPDLLERIPEVKVISRDDGEGCNCQNNSGAYALLFIILSFSRRRLAQAFSRQP